MLTKKGKYGLKAMAHLARFAPGRPVTVAEIATGQNIPKKFLDAILGELRNSGYVVSKMGKGGGYALARPAAGIIVGDIIRALDGPLAPLPCASQTSYRPCDDCGDVDRCQIRLLMQEARQALSAVLDNYTLEQACALGETIPLCYEI
ncbi:MAG TPA: Rrf2 family transcriptional regulator [Methylosinus sp.]|uniref:RrF2 family transcriptional regulator n=1 Tax=Methylosinus sp. TaxID=427 RepID=UPI002F95D90F